MLGKGTGGRRTVARTLGSEATGQSEIGWQEEICSLEHRWRRGGWRRWRGRDQGGGVRAVGAGHAVHVGVQGGGALQVRRARLQQHLLADGRKARSRGQQGKGSFRLRDSTM